MRHLIQPPPSPRGHASGRAAAVARSASRALGVGATLMVTVSLPMAGKGPPVWMESPLALAADGDDLTDDLMSGDPLRFSPEELQELHRRFGVHGPQPRLAQLFSSGINQLQPLRTRTLGQIETLRPVILSECAREQINPMLVTAILFDELRHAKPGEDHPIAAHSGLFTTHGPAQIGVGELVHQGLLSEDPSAEEITVARNQLLDPDQNVALLVGKFARLKRALDLPSDRMLEASGSARDAKGLATLAYLHNGKLDYPRGILALMQDPELHALIYGRQNRPVSPLI
ncbi:helicase DnaB [Cyanobium sp. ATX 6A2]|uniref:helicase DnaB n=1 Tax=Cyanobium sp. ATX 6A2 TaxID=2823700 RepID=UPI0020CBC5DD|nr:helicase DnaB [Cyanobium sp. ATX 6A2]